MLMDEIHRSFDAVSVSDQRVHAFREQFHIIGIQVIIFCARLESRRNLLPASNRHWLSWEILSFQLQCSEDVEFSAFAKRTSGLSFKTAYFLKNRHPGHS